MASTMSSPGQSWSMLTSVWLLAFGDQVSRACGNSFRMIDA